MAFKLVIAASKTWRRLKGENRLPILRGAFHQASKTKGQPAATSVLLATPPTKGNLASLGELASRNSPNYAQESPNTSGAYPIWGMR
jgi:hypothetical protein